MAVESRSVQCCVTILYTHACMGSGWQVHRKKEGGRAAASSTPLPGSRAVPPNTCCSKWGVGLSLTPFRAALT